MKTPIAMLVAFLVCVAAIISYALSGDSAAPSKSSEKIVKTQVDKATEVDLSKAPKIEPSSLTSALVDGKSPEKEATEDNTTDLAKDTGAASSDENKADDKEVTEAPASDETVTNTEEATEEQTTEEAADATTEVAKTEESEESKAEDTSSEATAIASNSTEEVEEKTNESVSNNENSSSATAYFKEHDVDPALNKPVTLAATPETETTTEEAAPATESTESETVKDEKTVVDTKETETAVADTQSSEGTATEAQAAVTTEAQFDELSADEMLLMAREAYWNNGLEESAEIYQQLISKKSDVIDYKGELGNVYWRQGLPKKAAELYAEISMPMIEAGDANRVANMVGFIGLFYPEKATEIHNKLESLK